MGIYCKLLPISEPYKVSSVSQVYVVKDHEDNNIFLVLKHQWGKIKPVDRSMKLEDYLLNTFLKKRPHIYSICGLFFENDRVLNYTLEASLEVELKENFDIIKANPKYRTAKFPGFLSDKHKVLKACSLFYDQASSYTKLDYMRRFKEYKSDICEHNRLPLYFKEINLKV